MTENLAKMQSDVSTLRQWLKTAQLDPNDPSNVPLFELLKVRVIATADSITLNVLLSRRRSLNNAGSVFFFVYFDSLKFYSHVQTQTNGTLF